MAQTFRCFFCAIRGSQVWGNGLVWRYLPCSEDHVTSHNEGASQVMSRMAGVRPHRGWSRLTVAASGRPEKYFVNASLNAGASK